MQDNSKTRVKTKRAITDRYALSLKPHVRLSTPQANPPRISSLAWASPTQVFSPLRVPGLYQHCTPCTSTWKTSLTNSFPTLSRVIFHVHLRTGDVLSVTWYRLDHFQAQKGSASQVLGGMTKRLVPGLRPSHPRDSVAELGKRPPLCQRQKRVQVRHYVERKVHSHSLRRPSISLCSSSFLR